jgi:hypothetical protein
MPDPQEHVQKLRSARSNAVKSRRQIADALAGPYKKGHTERM